MHYSDYVDPYIGSISYLLKATQPLVHLPHSMAQIRPVLDQRINDCYLAPEIYGFPANRGRIMPDTGDSPSFVSGFDHDFEQVRCYQGRVLLEDRSTSTLENLTFSKQAIEQAGGDPSRVAIVSSSYHLYRACRMASALGMEAEGLRSADGCPVYMTGMYLREALAVWKLWVSDIYMRPLGGIRFFFLPSP